MEKETTDLMPLIIALGGVLLVILKGASPYIINIMKSLSSIAEKKASSVEEAAKTEQKTQNLNYDAQNFLSDVGKNHYQQLNKQFEEQKGELKSLETQVSELRDKLQKASLDKEELRIKYSNLLDDHNDLKSGLAVREGSLSETSTKLQKAQERLRDMEIMIEKLQVQLNARIEEITRLTSELSEKRTELLNARNQIANLQAKMTENYRRVSEFNENPITSELSQLLETLRPSSAANPIITPAEIAAELAKSVTKPVTGTLPALPEAASKEVLPLPEDSPILSQVDATVVTLIPNQIIVDEVSGKEKTE